MYRTQKKYSLQELNHKHFSVFLQKNSHMAIFFFVHIFYNYLMAMLNKIDKLVLIFILLAVFSIILPVLLICIFLIYDINFMSEIIFIFSAICYIFILPICIFAQIVTLFIKILSTKDITKKDLIIIITNFIAVLFFSLLALYLLGIALIL